MRDLLGRPMSFSYLWKCGQTQGQVMLPLTWANYLLLGVETWDAVGDRFSYSDESKAIRTLTPLWWFIHQGRFREQISNQNCFQKLSLSSHPFYLRSRNTCWISSAMAEEVSHPWSPPTRPSPPKRRRQSQVKVDCRSPESGLRRAGGSRGMRNPPLC